jgi:hypothetical protein
LSGSQALSWAAAADIQSNRLSLRASFSCGRLRILAARPAGGEYFNPKILIGWQMKTITITVHLTEDEATALGQIVDMATAAQALAHYKANRERLIWLEDRPGVQKLRGYIRSPVFDEERATDVVHSAKNKVLEALEAAGIEVSPPEPEDDD